MGLEKQAGQGRWANNKDSGPYLTYLVKTSLSYSAERGLEVDKWITVTQPKMRVSWSGVLMDRQKFDIYFKVGVIGLLFHISGLSLITFHRMMACSVLFLVSSSHFIPTLSKWLQYGHIAIQREKWFSDLMLQLARKEKTPSNIFSDSPLASCHFLKQGRNRMMKT